MFTVCISNWKMKAIPALLGLTLAAGLMPSANAQGTWTALNNKPPETVGLMLQLMDGRVMAAGNDGGNGNNTWYTLTPDAHGSYVNGTWSTQAPMATKRLFYASKVLPNGDILIAGGEDSNTTDPNNITNDNSNLCERYYTLTNTWASVPTPTYGAAITDTSGNMKQPGDPWANIGAAMSTMLPDERVLLADLGTPTSALYDYTSNTWSPVNNRKAHDQESSDEEDWTLQPDGSVVTVDVLPQIQLPNADFSQRLFPGSETWVSTPNTPSILGDHISSELGPGMLLYNGLTLYIGGITHTALYNYLTNKWVSGPDQYGDDKTTALGSEDGPGDVEFNGKALICVAPVGDYPNGQHFLEYTYSATANPDGTYGSFLEVPPPASYDPSASGSFSTHFLQLPNGQILFADANTTNQLYVYTPQGAPKQSWRPVIYNITPRADGSYLLRGTQFNGLTEGSYYGDDFQNSTNYPLVRLTDHSGNIFYCRTYNPSTMGVATGNMAVSASVIPPDTLPVGSYNLEVVANGIASNPMAVVYPLGLASLTLSTDNVSTGSSVTGTITLNGQAPAGGFKVALSTSNTAIAKPTVTQVIVPKGSKTMNFTIKTLGAGTATIKGIQGVNIRTATLTVSSIDVP